MGDVIKVEVPVFRTPGGRFNPRNEFVFYTKGTNEANNQQVPRTILLREHQPTPIKVGWNGAHAQCTYCKQEGHFIKTCADRLSKICKACGAAGHVGTQCKRYGQRDREAEEAPSNAAETASTTTTLAAQAPSSRSPSPDHHDEFPEINITEQQWQDLNNTNDMSEMEDTNEDESGDLSEEGSEEVESENDRDKEGILDNTTTPTSNTSTTTTTERYQDRAPFTQGPLSQATSIDSSSIPLVLRDERTR
ncbi:hypothetical protein BGX28_010502 [Mortierella sp. GBA30]|nr:hypothetical protein BGX28_010502 [Mortierella sp. GBA30]